MTKETLRPLYSNFIHFMQLNRDTYAIFVNHDKNVYTSRVPQIYSLKTYWSLGSQ
jgi:hypothetical protein